MNHATALQLCTCSLEVRTKPYVDFQTEQDFSVWPFRSEPFRSDSFGSRDLSVRLWNRAEILH